MCKGHLSEASEQADSAEEDGAPGDDEAAAGVGDGGEAGEGDDDADGADREAPDDIFHTVGGVAHDARFWLEAEDAGVAANVAELFEVGSDGEPFGAALVAPPPLNYLRLCSFISAPRASRIPDIHALAVRGFLGFGNLGISTRSRFAIACFNR